MGRGSRRFVASGRGGTGPGTLKMKHLLWCDAPFKKALDYYRTETNRAAFLEITGCPAFRRLWRYDFSEPVARFEQL
jgi:hypothetical protein